MTAVFGYYRADADLRSAGEVIDIVKAAAAHQRFGWEEDNSAAHFLWALSHPPGSPAPGSVASKRRTQPCTPMTRGFEGSPGGTSKV